MSNNHGTMIDSLKVLPVGTILRSQSRTYTIVEVLGQGGFGITYRATAILTIENIKTTAQFAIKEHFVDRYCEREGVTNAVTYSRPVASEVENSRKDFLSEARRLRDLSKNQNRHPNIVCVNETFEANNTAYFVMEYLEGESLSSYVKSHGPLNDNEMRRVMKPIINAVAFLHRERITHLDIKPANIMLTRDDIGNQRPVLIDFGLSRHFDPETDEPSSSIQQAGFSAGYAPIEQVEAFSHFYPATDVYSLGATMLFALTGNTPVSAANLDEETLRSAIPAGLSTSTVKAIIEAMHYIRKQRPKDAAALLSILDDNEISQIISDDEIIPEIYTEPETRHTPKLVGEPPQFSYPKSKTTQQPILTPLPKRRPGPDSRIATPQPKSKKGLYIGISVCSLLVFLCVVWVTHGFGLIGEDSKEEIIKETKQEFPYHTTPTHLDLAAEINGQRVYLSSDAWKSLSTTEQEMYHKLGVVVSAKDEHFIVELHNKENNRKLTWNEAMEKYSDAMPTKAQGVALYSIDAETWKSLMNTYGGDTKGTFWTNEEYNSSNAWVINLISGYGQALKTESNMVREIIPTASKPVSSLAVKPHSSANHLDLAVKYDGDNHGYFSSDEWNNLSANEKMKYNKIGMVVSKKGQRFIVELEDKETDWIEWDDAMKKYCEVMPTKAQGEALASLGWETWKAKMNAFGGEDTPYFWTNEEYDSSNAWSVHINSGLVTYTIKSNQKRVRAVVPMR